MIISASRRTDIPAFFTEWFMNRIREGYCTLPNPMNVNQVVYVDLKPQQVDVIVFWTKNPAPLIPYLSELDEHGYRYYFQYTVNDYDRTLEPRVPELKNRISTFIKLAKCIEPRKVIWRYDPIIFSPKTTPDYHLEKFGEIASQLKGYAKRVVISIVDEYRAAVSRRKKLNEDKDFQIESVDSDDEKWKVFFSSLSKIAKENEMEIFSCAEEIDLDKCGIRHGKCIDDVYIKDVFGLLVNVGKDKAQREACGCIAARDIGIYDTCQHDCIYCYATRISDTKLRLIKHDPHSPSLIGRYEAEPKS